MDTISARTFEQKILFAGTQANYNALATKDTSKLYFTTDTNKLYKGSTDFSAAVRVVSALPASGSAANNVLYVVNNSGFKSAAYTVDGGANYVTIALAYLTSTTGIDDDSTTGNADDTTVPTTKAVVDYVTSKVGNSGAVTSISAHTTDKAKFSYNVAGGSTATDVEIPGVVTLPTWNSSTRVLTLPVTAFGSTSAQNVEVNIGKDALCDDAEYDATTEKIKFWTNTHTKADYPNDPSFEIDVAALITEIVVADTDSVDMTLTVNTAGSGNHEIKADVKLATKTNVTNYATILDGTSTGETAGIMVNLSTIEDSITNVDTSVANLETALTTWGTIPAAS